MWAESYLGHRYGLSGRVVPGDGRGRTIGYPTANIKPLSEKKIVPARGVYVVGAECRGKQYIGMMNIGVRPTVTEGTVQTLEVHLYEQKFSSVEELIRQLGKDKEESLQFMAEHGKRKFNNI
ncbi:MAG: riboflavin biosynthesis protein RibF [Bacteroidetes bacterium]|nr:riboflavin biosynthesis protein RibF [Bacteroidota bacterium]